MLKKRIITLIAGFLSAGLYAYQQYSPNSKQTIVETQSYSQSHQKQIFREYPDALKLLWTKVYSHGGKTLYCDKSFSTKTSQIRKKVANAEHVFPMSWVASDLDCGTRKQCQRKSKKFRQIEADLHNIYPSQIHVNKARANYRFGEINGEKREFGPCDFEVNREARIAEPTEKIRGDIARAMLYMEYQYGLSLRKKTKALMKKWDKLDQPTKEERRRHTVIKKLQGRENPFISQYPFNGKQSK